MRSSRGFPEGLDIANMLDLIIDILIILAKIAVVLGSLLTLTALLTWAERKESAMMQDRIGPNRANILKFRLYGLFHPIADAIKLVMKEDFVPGRANKFLYTIAPLIAMFPALVTFAVIPFGDTLIIGGKVIPLQVANLNIGILFVLAIASLGTYGIVIGGWSSSSNYSLLGALRAASQMISYEVTLGLSLVGVIMVYGSLELDQIVRAQGSLLWGFIPKWGVVVQPLALILFITASVAETKRAPFDLPEGESEIIGYFVEYSGMRFGMYYLGEFAEVVVSAALITTLFFGGWQIPFLAATGFSLPWGWSVPMPALLVTAMQVGAFAAKVVFFCWFLLLIRWTLPRFRYDQVMALCWKNLLPLSLVNIVVTGGVILGLQFT